MKASGKGLTLTNIKNILKPLLQVDLEEQSEEVPHVNKRGSLSNSAADLILHLLRLTSSCCFLAV